MKIKNIVAIIVFILICQLAGFIGSFFTSPAIPVWYASLSKPIFTPPSWIFAPAWVTLYLLMGISAYLVWSKGIKKKKVKIALSVFGIQLILNICWSLIFFGLHAILFAFIEIILLWCAILLTIIKFNKLSKSAALLLIPYILWVSFAAVLNLAILLLN